MQKAGHGVYCLYHRMRLRFLLGLGLLALLLTGCRQPSSSSAALQPPPKGTLQITFFDVGQGDAALIQFPNGKTMLVDGGPPESATALLGKLRQLRVQRIDWLVASHPHSDHIGGFVKILNTLPVGEVWDSGFAYDSPVYLDYLRAVRRSRAKFRTVEKGHRLKPAPDCLIEVFAPIKPFLRGTESDANNASIVMRLRYGKVRVLFTGDIEREGRRRLYAHRPDLRAEVLKVSHHGSYNGTDMAFKSRAPADCHHLVRCPKSLSASAPGGTARPEKDRCDCLSHRPAGRHSRTDSGQSVAGLHHAPISGARAYSPAYRTDGAVRLYR